MDLIDKYLFLAGVLGFMVERTLHATQLMARASLGDRFTQFTRYVIAAAGLVVSGFALGLPVAKFGLQAVIDRLNTYYAVDHVFGVAAWGIAGIHTLQIVLSVVMPVWWYFRPTRFSRKEHWLWGVPLENDRFMDQMAQKYRGRVQGISYEG